MNWTTRRIGEVIQVLSGFAFDSKHFSNEKGIPLIRIRDVIRGCSETFYQGKYDDKYIVERGDILIGMDGEFNIARWQGEPALLNQRVCKISISNIGILSSKYLYYALPKKLKEIEARTPFVTVKHLSVNDIKKIEIPLPPLHIQQQIANTLDKADAPRQKDQQLLKKYDELAQSIFYDMFGEMGENIFRFPKVNLGELISIPRKLVDPRVEPYCNLLHVGGDNIVSKTGELINLQKAKSLSLISGKFLFNKNYILYNKIRPYLDKVALPSFEGICSADMYPLLPGNRVVKEFLYFVLKSQDFLSYVGGQARRANIPKVNRSELNDYRCVLPPVKLQKKFAKLFNTNEEQLKVVKSQLQLSTSLFYGLLSINFNN